MCRTLRADEIECRVAQVTAKGCSLLLYKTARVDRAILTEIYGNRWQNDFKVIDGKMYGGIAIYDNDLKEWLWRWDCGTEPMTEKEKGEASDCFKRAGFKWGIGIELYTAPFIFANVPTEFNKEKKKWELVNKFEKFDVKSISYKDGVIDKLEIINSKKETVYIKGQYKKEPTIPSKQEKSAAEELFPEEKESPDVDIIAGLAAIEDLENLEIYYYQNVERVSDSKAFNVAVNRRKKVLQNGK